MRALFSALPLLSLALAAPAAAQEDGEANGHAEEGGNILYYGGGKAKGKGKGKGQKRGKGKAKTKVPASQQMTETRSSRRLRELLRLMERLGS